MRTTTQHNPVMHITIDDCNIVECVHEDGLCHDTATLCRSTAAAMSMARYLAAKYGCSWSFSFDKGGEE